MERKFVIKLTIPDDTVFADEDLTRWVDACCEYGFQYTEDDEYSNHEWEVEEV